MWIVPLRLLDGASASGVVVTVTPGVQVADASIANFFVMDMRIKRRRPITPEEFALLKQFVQVRDRVRGKYLREQRELRALSREFSRQLGFRHVDSYQPIRLPYRGDYSGLVPVKRRAVGMWNGVKGRDTLRRHVKGSERAERSKPFGLRQSVRVDASRATRV